MQLCHMNARSNPIYYFSDKPCSRFKPGQTTLDRDYYAQATTVKADGDACLANY